MWDIPHRIMYLMVILFWVAVEAFCGGASLEEVSHRSFITPPSILFPVYFLLSSPEKHDGVRNLSSHSCHRWPWMLGTELSSYEKSAFLSYLSSPISGSLCVWLQLWEESDSPHKTWAQLQTHAKDSTHKPWFPSYHQVLYHEGLEGNLFSLIIKYNIQKEVRGGGRLGWKLSRYIIMHLKLLKINKIY